MKLLGNNVKLFVYDFDGVMTDNTAILFHNGQEAVKVNRGDGLAIEKIKKLGVKQLIMSSEKNPIVLKRAEKLQIGALNNVESKDETLSNYLLKQRDISLNEVAFVGNDINDYEVMKIVGLKICPQDAVKEIKSISDFITDAKGGSGVIREIYSKICEENND